MLSQKIIILAGADIDDYSWHRQQIDANDIVICADSGARHAKVMDIMPDTIIGDFDSIDLKLLKGYEGQCDIIRDDNQNTTDLMKALAQCPDELQIEIYGAIGQRADHDFSNYLILMGMDNPDRIVLKTKNETRRVVKSSATIKGHIGDVMGLFPLSKINNFKVKGLKYTPDVLGEPYDFGWNGACNEMVEDIVEISFDKGGALLLTQTQKNRAV